MRPTREARAGSLHPRIGATLQACLDEFVFRFHPRANPEAVFQSLLGLGTRHPPVRRAISIRASDLPCNDEGDEIEDGAIA